MNTACFSCESEREVSYLSRGTKWGGRHIYWNQGFSHNQWNYVSALEEDAVRVEYVSKLFVDPVNDMLEKRTLIQQRKRIREMQHVMKRPLIWRVVDTSYSEKKQIPQHFRKPLLFERRKIISDVNKRTMWNLPRKSWDEMRNRKRHTH